MTKKKNTAAADVSKTHDVVRVGSKTYFKPKTERPAAPPPPAENKENADK
jgi:hypothetical protein